MSELSHTIVNKKLKQKEKNSGNMHDKTYHIDRSVYILLYTYSLGRQVEYHLQVSLPASISCSVDVS